MVQLGKEDKPRGIDLDVCEGMVYWTNWNRRHPAIQRAYYSGFNRQDLITENVHMPNGLALDLAERKLYWADARLDKIEVNAVFSGVHHSSCLLSRSVVWTGATARPWPSPWLFIHLIWQSTRYPPAWGSM